MKTILTIIVLLIAMIAVKTSNANSQDTCTPAYVSCMDICVAKKTGQDQCIGVCQQKNDQCAANVYGSAVPQTGTTQRPKESGEAMDARDDGVAEPVKEAAKPRARTPQVR